MEEEGKKKSSGLTEEQKIRIQKNRERALEIQRRKRKEREEEEEKNKKNNNNIKKRNVDDVKKDNDEKLQNKKEEKRNVVEELLEEFEINASNLVSKKEAKEMYCLPEGTLAVCSFVEKDNPRNRGWTKMKLYDRSEIRAKAWRRYGGMEGLIAERESRVMKRFKKDLEATKDVFK